MIRLFDYLILVYLPFQHYVSNLWGYETLSNKNKGGIEECRGKNYGIIFNMDPITNYLRHLQQ